MCCRAWAQAFKSDSVRVFALIDIANEKQAQGFPDSAEHYCKMAGKLAEDLDADAGRMGFAGRDRVSHYHQVHCDETLAMTQRQLALGVESNSKQKTSNGENH